MNDFTGYQKFHEEINRIRTLYRQARYLGQDERADELIDEMKGLIFNRYSFTVRLAELVKERAEREENPRIKELLESLVESSCFFAGEYARLLNQFIFDTIELTHLNLN